MLTLFEKIRHIGPYEIEGFNEKVGDHLIPYDTYWLDYTAFPSFEEHSKGEELLNCQMQINSDLDPENLSSKDPIKFCRTHNDSQLKIILEYYWKLMKEHLSYQSESKVTGPEVDYYEIVLQNFRSWYRRNNIDLPEFDNIDEFLKLRGFNPTFIDKQNQLLEDHHKLVTNKTKKPYRKMDLNKLAREFVKLILQTNDSWPKLKEFNKSTGIPVSTLSKKLYNLELLYKILKLIEKKQITMNVDELELFKETKDEITKRLKKKGKIHSKDIYSKGKRSSFNDSQKVDQENDEDADAEDDD